MKLNTKTKAALLIAVAAQYSSAVTLTFDSDLEGFVSQGQAESVAHSAFGGGSMAITVNGASGWRGNTAQLALGATSLWPEFQQAAINGGTLSFKLSIDTNASNSSLAVSGTAPNWLQPVVVANSAGGWDQNIMASSNIATGVSWPTANAEESINVSLPIVSSGGTGNDGNFYSDTSNGWTNLNIGINSQGPAWNGNYTFYIDDLTVTAVPEASTAALALFASLAFLRRKR